MNCALCSRRCDCGVADSCAAWACSPSRSSRPRQPHTGQVAGVTFEATARQRRQSVATTAPTALSQARSWIIPTFQCRRGFRQRYGASWRWCGARPRAAARGRSGGNRFTVLGDIPDSPVGATKAVTPGGFALAYDHAGCTEHIGALRRAHTRAAPPTLAGIRPPSSRAPGATPLMPAIHLTAHHFAPCDDFRPWERGRSPGARSGSPGRRMHGRAFQPVGAPRVPPSFAAVGKQVRPGDGPSDASAQGVITVRREGGMTGRVSSPLE